MDFSEILGKKVQQQIQRNKPGPKDCVSLYNILRSAKHHYTLATYADLSSALLTLLSGKFDIKFFIINKDTIVDTEMINFGQCLELDYKKGKLTSPELANYVAITPTLLLSGINESLSNESLHTHGFLRNEIAPLLDFELMNVAEDKTNDKEKYSQRLAEREIQNPPPLKGENYAIKREELLIAALAIIGQNQKDGKKIIVPTITDLLDEIEKQAKKFWPSTETLPMSRKEAAEQLGFALNLFARQIQDLESLRAIKKQKRKN